MRLVRVPTVLAESSSVTRTVQALYKSQIRLEALGPRDFIGTTSVSPVRLSTTQQLSSYTMFEVQDFISKSEANALVKFADRGRGPQGFQREYSPQYRSGSRLLFKSEELSRLLWNRLKPLICARDTEGNRPSGFGTQGTWVPTGVNTVFRIAKYGAQSPYPPEPPKSTPARCFSLFGNAAKPSGSASSSNASPSSLNASSPPSSIKQGQEIGQGFQRHLDAGFCLTNENRSVWSLLVYLRGGGGGGGGSSEEQKEEQKEEEEGLFEGGTTTFWADPQQTGVITHCIQPIPGNAVVFNHNIPHQGNIVTRGIKYVLRCDVMFSLVEALPPSVALDVARDARYFLVRHLYHQCIEAARQNQPEQSTTAFIQALDVLAFSRQPTLLAAELQPLQHTWARLDDNTLFHLLSHFIDATQLCTLACCSRYFRRRCGNSQLWKQCYTRRWPEAARWEVTRLPLDATNPALVSYKQLYKAQLERRASRHSSSLFIHFGRRHIRVMGDVFDGQDTVTIKHLVLPNLAVVSELEMNDYWGYHHESHQVSLWPALRNALVSTAKDENDIDWLMTEEMFNGRDDTLGGSWSTPIQSDWLCVCIDELFKCLALWWNPVSCLERIVVSCSRPYSRRFKADLQRVCQMQAKSCFGGATGRVSVQFAERAVVSVLHALALPRKCAGGGGLEANKGQELRPAIPAGPTLGIVVRSGFRASSVELVRDNRVLAHEVLLDTGSLAYATSTSSSHSAAAAAASVTQTNHNNIVAMHDGDHSDDEHVPVVKQGGLDVVLASLRTDGVLADEWSAPDTFGFLDDDDVVPVFDADIVLKALQQDSFQKHAVHDVSTTPHASTTATILDRLQSSIVQLLTQQEQEQDAATECPTVQSIHVVLTGGNMLVGNLGTKLGTWLSSGAFLSFTHGCRDIHIYHDTQLTFGLLGSRTFTELFP